MTVSYADHLLPSNATDLEKILAATGRKITDIPVPIDIVKRPYLTPDAFVPFLAYEYGVDIWRNSWDIDRKRNVVNASIPLHFKKGTAYAIKEYVRYVDGEVQKIERPPMRVFSGPSLTKEDREKWLASLPQVRVFTFRAGGPAAVHKAFLGRHSNIVKSRHFFREGQFSVPTDAKTRLARRAIWNVKGVDTATTVTDFNSFYQLHLRAPVGRRVMTGKPFAPRYYVPSDAWRRLVTIAPTPTTPWQIAVGPTLQAVQARPEWVYQRAPRGRGVYSGSVFFRNTGSFMRRDFFVPSTSKYRVFERYPVYDGSVGLRRPNVQFMGVGRYSFPSHTATIHVSVPGKRSQFEASSDGIFVPRKRFWIPHDPEPLNQVRFAVRAAKRLSDKILLKSGPVPRFVAGKPFIAGTDKFVVGRP